MKFNGKNVTISPSARIGRNVRIGDNTTIGDHVEIGDDCVIANDCVIGEPLSAYYDPAVDYANPPTRIGPGCLIRSHAIVYAGCDIGAGFSTGHRVILREYCVIGEHCRIGTNCDLQGYLQIGNYCWLHSGVFVAQYTRLADFVFVYPMVMFANDRFPPSNEAQGARVGRFSQIAASSLIMAGVTLGEHVLIGSGAVVTRDVPDYTLALGNPAKAVKDVRQLRDPATGEALYPWMGRFERGMPWEGLGYEKWADTAD